MRHYFVVNPRSFGSEEALNEFYASVERIVSRYADYRVHVSKRPREAISAIRKYMETLPASETVRIYAVGGDGILFDCLNGVMGLPNAELAVVPYGKQNDFVRSFGEGKNSYFLDLEEQVRAPTLRVDVVRSGANYSLNGGIVGIEAAANFAYIQLSHLDFLRKPKWGWLLNLIYTFGAFRNIFNKRLIWQKYHLVADGEDISGHYLLINAANAPCYGGDKCAVPSAVPNDGWLNLMTCKSTGKLRLLRMLVPYIHGGYKKFPKYLKCRRIRKLEISSNEPIMIDLDGEVFYDTNLTVEIVPQALKLVVPHGLRFYNRERGEYC
jgi:diacylglycerol kinase family enzyme